MLNCVFFIIGPNFYGTKEKKEIILPHDFFDYFGLVEFVQTKIGEGFAIFMLYSNFGKTITNLPIVIYFCFLVAEK